MKQIVRISIAFTLVAALVACGTTQTSSNSYSNVSSSALKDETAILWQQTSAEYTALCHQAFNIAQARLKGKEVDELSGQSPMAVVMDLDETVMDNSPYNGYLTLNGQSYEEESWRKWVQKAEAELVPGAKEFIEFTKRAGITVFYISNRQDYLLDYTLSNLKNQGLDVDPNNVYLKEDDSKKIERRNRVLRKYEIVMLIGDNLADFHDAFEVDLDIPERKAQVEEFKKEFGKKFIILPNPMYGKWQSTLKRRNPNSIENPSLDGGLKFMKSFK